MTKPNRISEPSRVPAHTTATVWLLEAVTAAHDQASPETAERAAARAREVPLTGRAAHTVDVVNGVLARAASPEQPANQHLDSA